MRWRWWVVLGLSACVGYDADDGYQMPVDECHRFAIDAPTKLDAWSTNQSLITVSGYGGRPPIRWRNVTTGASGDGEVVETIEYDPWFCPEGCPVRRFGAYVPLAAGANRVELTDETCTDGLSIEYVQ